MKNTIKFTKRHFIKTLLLAIAVTTLSSTNAQESKDKVAALQTIINSKNFVFKAQSVLPQRGGIRHLTSDYDLRILGDSVVSYLPYFGRAYSAPIDPTKGGIEFTSTDFTYNAKEGKKGWDITILPKDTRDVRQLFLSVSSNGYARLQVFSNNRETIAFNGIVEGRE